MEKHALTTFEFTRKICTLKLLPRVNVANKTTSDIEELTYFIWNKIYHTKHYTKYYTKYYAAQYSYCASIGFRENAN